MKLSPKNNFYASLGGTGLVALCCFTPILVIGLAIAGVGVFTPYLDYVLYPLLALLLILTWVSYRKYKTSCDCDVKLSD